MAVGLLIMAGTAGFGWQRWQAALLRVRLEALREEVRELASLRAENERLKRAQPPPEEIVRRRAEHEALLRMREEAEAARARLGLR